MNAPSPHNPAVANIQITRVTGRSKICTDDAIAVEEPLEIRVRGESVAVTMRTPGHDAELAAGFLLSEGIIRAREEIVEIAPCPANESRGNVLNVFVRPDVEIDLTKLSRHVFASSSCGICGKASVDAVHLHFPPVQSKLCISQKVLVGLPAKLRAAQKTFDQTGGLHGAAIFDANGNLLACREDVGRHNAVDKVIGRALLDGWPPLSDHILVVSGRASFEIIQKALSAAFPIIAAVSAPSSLAVELADESSQTLVGFLREETFNIYSHPERIAAS